MTDGMMIEMHGSAWNGVADYGPLFIPIIVTVGSVIHVWRVRDRRPGQAAEIVLLWFFGGAVGVGGLVVTASHVFFADATAEQIGFPTGNPFQFEVAMANLAFAVLGLLCLRVQGEVLGGDGDRFRRLLLGRGTGSLHRTLRPR